MTLFTKTNRADNPTKVVRPARGLVSLQQRFEANGGDSDDEDEPTFAERVQREWSEFNAVQSAGNLKRKYEMFLRFTWKEMRKRKVSYCLGTCSCFVVVFSVAFLMTILANVPLVFLRLAESEEGESDLVLHNGGGDAREAYSLNYHTVTSTAEALGSQYSYHSPRLHFSEEFVFTANPADCGAQGDDVTYSRETPFDWVFTPPQSLQHVINHCHFSFVECLPYVCSSMDHAHLFVIDSAKEKRMGYGRAWEWDRIPAGNVVISENIAKVLRLKEGDTMLLGAALSPALVGLFEENNLAEEAFPYSQYKTTAMPVRVFAVVEDGAMGKLSSETEYFMFMELDGFMDRAVRFMDPALSDVQKAQLRGTDILQYVQDIAINLAPGDRYDAYLVSDYDTIQHTVTTWAAPLLFKIGFNQCDATAGILSYMKDIRLFSMFLGLIISLVIAVMMALAIILIYSLLMINVETRTFDLGVLRMLGMQKPDAVQLVLTQAFMYAFPAWVGGLISALITWSAIRTVMAKEVLVELPIGLDPLAVGIATLVGILIPMLAAVFPIRMCLGLSLGDALDTSRSKTKAVSYSYNRSEGSTVSVPLLILGTSMTVFGFCLYYLFPLALLSFNIALLFYIFFGILMGLLFGLILLALNFEHMVEQGLTQLIFFWENYAVRTLIIKNLVAHRVRNRKTTLMFALSLGFVIWINVSWELQVESVSFATKQKLGADMVVAVDEVDSPPIKWHTASRIDELLQEMHPEIVKNWGYVTTPLHKAPGMSDTRIASLGKFREFRCNILGVSPNILGEVSNSDFLKIDQSNASHGASPSEHLYTKWAYDSAIVGTLYHDTLGKKGLGGDNPSMNLKVTAYDADRQKDLKHYVGIRSAAVLDTSPLVKMSKFPARKKQDVLVSLPTYLALSQGWIRSLREITYNRIVIDLTEATTANAEAVETKILTNLEGYGGHRDIAIKDIHSETKAIRNASKILRLFFMGITLITMTMCFFSLTASMYSNIQLQSKEIGVMRSLGLTSRATKRLYCWEAFILVVSASCMGFCVGTAVAYTMVLQRSLFLELPLTLIFPVELFLLVVVLAFFFSFVSSYGPAENLLRRTIVAILRKTH